VATPCSLQRTRHRSSSPNLRIERKRNIRRRSAGESTGL
jgi:hypothetical protein